MKIVVIGGTGLIGSRVVSCLAEEEHEPKRERVLGRVSLAL